MGILGLALLIVAWQTSFIGLIAALFFVGLVRTGIIPMVNRVITEQVDATQRGARMGVIYAAVPFGGVVGALVLPAVAQLLGWSAGYVLLGSIALLGGLVAWKLRPQRRYFPAFPPAGSRLYHHHPLQDIHYISSYVWIIWAEHDRRCFRDPVPGRCGKNNRIHRRGIFRPDPIDRGRREGFLGILADRYFSKNRWWLLATTSWLLVIAFTLLTRLNSTSAWWMIVGVMIAIGMSSASSWGILSTLTGDVVGIELVAIASATVFFVTNITDVMGPLLV